MGTENRTALLICTSNGHRREDPTAPFDQHSSNGMEPEDHRDRGRVAHGC